VIFRRRKVPEVTLELGHLVEECFVCGKPVRVFVWAVAKVEDRRVASREDVVKLVDYEKVPTATVFGSRSETKFVVVCTSCYERFRKLYEEEWRKLEEVGEGSPFESYCENTLAFPSVDDIIEVAKKRGYKLTKPFEKVSLVTEWIHGIATELLDQYGRRIAVAYVSNDTLLERIKKELGTEKEGF